MKYLTTFALTLALVHLCRAQTAASTSAEQPAAGAAGQEQPPRRPKINWGKCPQLEPSEKDIEFKSNILQECLRQNPPPQQQEGITQEQIIEHQRNVTECALKIEKWFDNKGQYKFDKAEKEIKNKKLSKEMEQALLQSHQQCADISRERAKLAKGKMATVEQVQIYQGCMDAHITQHCQIQIGV